MSELKSRSNMSCLRMIGTQNGSAIRFIPRVKKGHENEVFFTCGQFIGMVCKTAQDFCKQLQADMQADKLSKDEARQKLAELNFCELSIDGSDWIPAVDVNHSPIKGIII